MSEIWTITLSFYLGANVIERFFFWLSLDIRHCLLLFTVVHVEFTWHYSKWNNLWYEKLNVFKIAQLSLLQTNLRTANNDYVEVLNPSISFVRYLDWLSFKTQNSQLQKYVEEAFYFINVKSNVIEVIHNKNSLSQDVKITTLLFYIIIVI